MRLLLINPNTSTHITERMAASARSALGSMETLTAVTATGSPRVVRSAADLLQADANTIALAEQHVRQHDAIVLGISLDGAAVPLRARYPGVPIVGMTEAALLTACLRAERVGLLTLGASTLPLYRDRVTQIGIGSRVVAYSAPEAPLAFGAQAAGVAPDVLDVLAKACAQMHDSGAQVIVLAGAVLCGYAETLHARCTLPVLDGITCAVGQVRMLFGKTTAV